MFQPITLLAPAFSNYPEYTVITTANSGGTTVANTFGAWTQIGTSPPYKCNRIWLTGRPNNNNTALPGLVNIGIGPSGSQKIILPNLVFNSMQDFDGPPVSWNFPTKIPQSMDIWAQMAQDSSTTYNFEVGGICWNDNTDDSGIVTSYADISTSSGIQVSVSGSGSWGPVTITSSSGQFKRYAFSILPVGQPTYMSISTEILLNGDAIFPALVTFIGNGGINVTTTPGLWGPFECDIPAGSTITMQGYAATGGSVSFQIAFYGIS